MSSKSTIILTNDNEHWYKESSEILSDNPYRYAITLEFSKKNIRIDLNDEEDLVISIINPESEIHKVISNLDSTLPRRSIEEISEKIESYKSEQKRYERLSKDYPNDFDFKREMYGYASKVFALEWVMFFQK